MDTKLTLKLNAAIIEQAKGYARDRNTSLSKLVESYLGQLAAPEKIHEITPLVKSISGVIALPKGYDYKKERRKHLVNKYKK